MKLEWVKWRMLAVVLALGASISKEKVIGETDVAE
jgi:hypothetical protein